MTDRERVVRLLRLHGDPTEVAALLGTDPDTIHAIMRGDSGASLPPSGGGGGGAGASAPGTPNVRGPGDVAFNQVISSGDLGSSSSLSFVTAHCRLTAAAAQSGSAYATFAAVAIDGDGNEEIVAQSGIVGADPELPVAEIFDAALAFWVPAGYSYKITQEAIGDPAASAHTQIAAITELPFDVALDGAAPAPDPVGVSYDLLLAFGADLEADGWDGLWSNSVELLPGRPDTRSAAAVFYLPQAVIDGNMGWNVHFRMVCGGAPLQPGDGLLSLVNVTDGNGARFDVVGGTPIPANNTPTSVPLSFYENIGPTGWPGGPPAQADNIVVPSAGVWLATLEFSAGVVPS